MNIFLLIVGSLAAGCICFTTSKVFELHRRLTALEKAAEMKEQK